MNGREFRYPSKTIGKKNCLHITQLSELFLNASQAKEKQSATNLKLKTQINSPKAENI